MTARGVLMSDGLETAGDKGARALRRRIDDGQLQHARARDSERETLWLRGAKGGLEIKQSEVREEGKGCSDLC